MVNISKLGDSTIKFTFTDNDRYLYNGEITLPLNSLILEFDVSDLVIFKKIDGDVFVTFLLENSNFDSKDSLIDFYKTSMVGSTGGDITSGEVQTMIDESISGKADTSSLATVATSGSYNDLDNKPTIPTVPTSNTAFTNDAQYATSGYVDSAVSGKANSSDVYTTGQTSGATEIANALSAKLDATAYTPTDLSEYWTSAQTSSAIDEATSGKQDTLVSSTNIKTINNESILGSGNITIQGGGGGTVDKTPIYTYWRNEFKDPSRDIKLRKATLNFKGDKSITTSTNVNLEIFNQSSNSWIYPYVTLDYVNGTYIKYQDENNVLVVEYDSEIEDFKLSISNDYPNAFFTNISFYSNEIIVESATIESGSTSDVIETSVANIFGNLYTKDLANVNNVYLSVASPKNLNLVSQYKNGISSQYNLKLTDLIATVDGGDKILSTDIKVPLGTSGWTEVSNISASTCTLDSLGEPLPFTSFRITYDTNDMNMINLRLRAGATNFSTSFYINWDSSQNKFVVSNETFSATTITLDTTNHTLTIELPATVEYGGSQGQTILFGLSSTRCQFGYSITKLEYYGEETQDLIPYIKQLRSDVDSILNSIQNNS